MSVKSKVKRCNKRIQELEEEVKRLKAKNMEFPYIPFDRRKEEIENYKDNFIKMILNQRKTLEHNCCRFQISIGQLETMKNARLEVERNREYFDTVDFILKV